MSQLDPLSQFRIDLLTALTDLQIEVRAVQSALLASGALEEKDLKQFRALEQSRSHAFRDKLAQDIHSPNLPL